MTDRESAGTAHTVNAVHREHIAGTCPHNLRFLASKDGLASHKEAV